MISIYEKKCLRGSILEFLRYVCVRYDTIRIYINIYIRIYIYILYIFTILAVYYSCYKLENSYQPEPYTSALIKNS